MSPLRRILLVGEGNFSFSACLSQSYSGTETSVTATSLQPPEEALRHVGAAVNIQTIKDSGGEVIFEVDCRMLGECVSLRGRVFDRVLFNFPHCGRKSGVKSNRELLKSFFLSCVKVLAEDGDVHVSLCNGQGGTPADHPQREWHNSWQVVAMAAEAHLILTDVRPFESEKYHSYKCTGYRSQDKGFRVEEALVHVFTRSLPYTSVPMLQMEEVVEGEKVRYSIPAELSDFMFRGFLHSDSVHPVRLVQDFLLEGLSEKWSVSLATETIPFLLTAKQLQLRCRDIHGAHCYWVGLDRKDLNSDTGASPHNMRDPSMFLDSQPCTDTRAAPLATCVCSDEVDRVRSKGLERRVRSLDKNPEGGNGLFVLRPSLLPQMEELLTKKEEVINSRSRGENVGKNESVEGHKDEGTRGDCNGAPSVLFGISGVVFRNVSVSIWAMPCYHELLVRGVFLSESEPITLFGQWLETLLSPYRVSLVTEQGGLCLMAQPMGLVGRVFASQKGSHVNVTVSLNLDLLAVLLFSFSDWRPLWSHDPRLLKQFALRPSPGKPFHPLSLFPQRIHFDISFWTGPTWEERKFHAVVREASHGTVEHVQLIDTFSHPDLSQTSYCYRLDYHSHTHALSHTQALQFHKCLEALLASRLQVTIR